MRGKLNFQMRWKFRIEKGRLLNKFSAVAGDTVLIAPVSGQIPC
jgi:hypothetical protein